MDIKMIGKAARNKLIQDLFSAFQRQLNLSEEEISKFRHEAFLVESNEEQILKWEKFMNLEEKPDYSLRDRVDRVLFTLQSRGSFTPDFLKEQAKIFMNGIIDIEELFNEYSFTIIFKDIVGLPPNLDNFKDMLELNKPAHLTYKFKFRYNTHGQLEVLTHGEMEQYTHDELYQKRVFDDSQLPDGTPIVRMVRKIKAVASLIFPLKTDYYNVDIFNDNFKYLDEHKLEKGGYTGTAQNLLTEISKITSKSILGRIIIGKGLSVDSSGRTSVVSKNDGINVNENDIQLNTINNLTTDSETKPLSAKQGKILEENKQNKNDNTLKTTAKNIVGAINELFTELWKTGSTTQFGRFKVGKNLSVDENGFLNGNPQYTHPTGNGNSHLPSGGATGKFIKWLSSGVGQWASITWNDITGKPSSFTPSSHNHTKAEIKDFPTSLKNPTPLTIQANGTSLGSYDGSAAKTFNITAGNIGASPGNHNHDSTYSKTSHTHTASQVGAYTKNEIDTKLKEKEPAFSKNTAFNKSFGTNSNQVLEGVKLAETLGIPYGGGLNNSNTKTAGYAYYDSTTKKTYKCTVTNTLNYADASKFEAISNADLLTKFQNLDKSYVIEIGLKSSIYYRKYNDGFLEQWGISSGNWEGLTVNFAFSYKDTNYCAMITSIADKAPISGDGTESIRNKATNSMYVSTGNSRSSSIQWYTCGYC